MRLLYKKRALRHLTSIHNYIAQDNPRAANDVVRAIGRSIERLCHFPFSGRPGSVKTTRLLVVPNLPYIVVHRVRTDVVEIIAILHTRQHRK